MGPRLGSASILSCRSLRHERDCCWNRSSEVPKSTYSGYPSAPSNPEHPPVWISCVDVMYAHRKRPGADTIVSINGSWSDETGYGLVEVGKDAELRAKIDAHLERAINTAGQLDAVGIVYWEEIPGTQLTREELEEVVLAAARALLYVLMDRRLRPPIPLGPTLGPDGRPIKSATPNMGGKPS